MRNFAYITISDAWIHFGLMSAGI